MKILAIRGKNLASLENEFDIDFTREPLRSSGIFAITGNTGAGKSTILDALCLALFDNAPRLKEAEQIEILDTEDKTITQRDSRNILRRGAGEGYAEVDFIALNGDKYRSRWTVKRARGKTDGALQQTGIILENLSASSQEQGTKTELLKKITEIIGLTFGQFTRAVLLAQNDFSTFLKSKQSEKAELLEKLTGTEVYSRISSVIYQKTSDAKNALSLIQQRIADVKLLSEEELGLFLQEKEKLESEIKPLKEWQSSIEKKQEWIKQELILKDEITDAEKKLNTILEKIQEAGSRYEYLHLIDVAQEIRDTYFSWKEKQNQSDKALEQITVGRKALDEISKQLEIAEKELLAAKNKWEENEQRYTSAKPEIEKAKELDITILSAEKNVKESRGEFEIQEKNKNETEKIITVLQDEIAGIRKKNEERKNWFTGKEAYQPIVTRIDLLVTLLNDIQLSQKQILQHSEILKNSKGLLGSYLDKLKQQEAEAERLDKLLPAEIMQLRAGLEEGKPCPVCGSTHHPLKERFPATDINEKELTRSREAIANATAETQKHIERTQTEITQQETLIGNYRKQHEETTHKAADAFREIPGWEKELEKGRFQERLTRFAEQWKKNEEQLQAGIKTVDIQQARLENENIHLKQMLDTYHRKKETWQKHVSLFGQLEKKRKLLLNGEKTETIEIRFQKLREEYTQKKESKKEAKEKLDNEKARINGVLSQLVKDSEIYQKEAEKLLKEVKDWIENPKHPITFDLLTGLMSKTATWIVEEKKYL
ncbi:MAG: AAA family ATPase, partial [Bacteroidales bacterium]|nr:AAA family ATPase [Bacteroidales bacterium]